MRRGFGPLALMCAVTACGNTDRNENDSDGGTDPMSSQGGTDPNGQGGTEPNGQGGTDFQVMGLDEYGPGSGIPNSNGNMAADAGIPGAGGTAGSVGAAGAAGYHAGTCEDRCVQCREGYVLAECDSACICESESVSVKEDHQALLACDFDEPCPQSVLHRYPGSVSWEGGECLLSALRDGTPGRYRFRSTFSDIGSQISDTTLLVTGSDEVLVLEVSTSGLEGGNLERRYLRVQSCTLQDHDTLDACVAAGTDLSASTTSGDGQAVCADAARWVRDCVELRDPACPGE